MNSKQVFAGVLLAIVLIFVFGVGNQSDSKLHAPHSRPIKQVAARHVPHKETKTIEASEKRAKRILAESTVHSLGESQSSIPTVSLTDLLKQSIQPATVRSPTASELNDFTRLFSQTLRAKAVTPRLTTQWNAAGWDVSYCNKNKSIIAISEHHGKRSGRGVYAVRLNSDSKVTLQAPHRFFDAGSGLIARRLFQSHDVRAVAWNTVHRRKIDLADTDQHFVNAFTEAIVTVDRESRVIQLHGFGDNTQDRIDGHVNLIVSNGTRYPGRLAIRVTSELKQSIGATAVRLFPDEAELMGGTQNRQGNLMRNLGSANFLHVEIDKAYRELLRNDASIRAEFFRSFTDASK